MKRILIAGGTGAVGSPALHLARSQGHWVRALARSAESAKRLEPIADEVVRGDLRYPSSLVGIAKEIDVVLSAAGASVDLGAKERRRFRDVDTAGHANLIHEAKQAGVSRFVYVGVHTAPGYAHTAYMRAHEEVVRQLAASGFSYTVIRPTGIFSAFAVMVGMARKGRLGIIGNGSARTNPISPSDVASLCLQYLSEGPTEISAGGPDILTRREIAELACRAAGRHPKFASAPPFVPKAIGKIAGLFHPRIGELLEFLTAVATSDSVAPQAGKQHLADFFRTLQR